MHSPYDCFFFLLSVNRTTTMKVTWRKLKSLESVEYEMSFVIWRDGKHCVRGCCLLRHRDYTVISVGSIFHSSKTESGGSGRIESFVSQLLSINSFSWNGNMPREDNVAYLLTYINRDRVESFWLWFRGASSRNKKKFHQESQKLLWFHL